MTSKQWVSLIVVAVIFGGGGFFGGIKYQQSKTPAVAARNGQFAGSAGAGGFAGRRLGGAAGGGSFVSGSVLSSGSGTMTVKNMAGGSQIVILAPSTQYRKAVDGSAGDITVGSQVTVTGSTNADGSLTAQSVQIRNASSTPPTSAPGQ